MVTAKEVAAAKLIERAKEEVKKFPEVKPPKWSKFAKSSVSRERPPSQPDFWYIRASSILRRVYLDGPIGVQRLRTFYGGRKRKGTEPAHFRKGSGSVIRKILQQLESAGLVEKTESGRKITNKGRKFLDKMAYEVSQK